MSHYIQYYDDQAGGGKAGVRHVYTGATYQRGSGIGSFLGAIFRQIAPYLASGAKAVGREAVKTGLNVLDDVSSGGINFKEALNTRVRESGKNLQKKAAKKVSEMLMKGSGYKQRGGRRKRQSRKGRASARSKQRKTRKHRGAVGKKKLRPKRKTGRRKKTLRSITDIFGPK